MEISEIIEKLNDIQWGLERYEDTKDSQGLRIAYDLLTQARLAVGEKIKKEKS